MQCRRFIKLRNCNKFDMDNQGGIWPDENGRIFNIFHELMPEAAEQYISRNESLAFSSRQKNIDYQQLKTSLINLKLGQTKETITEQDKKEVSPVRKLQKSRKSTTTWADLQKRVIVQTERTKGFATKPLPDQVKAFLSTHVSRLIQPMHDTIANKIRRDERNAQMNICKAIGMYKINQAYYHKMYEEHNDIVNNPQIRQLLLKKKAILQQNAKAIDSDLFCQNNRLIRTRSSRKLSSRQTNVEFKNCFDKLLDYAGEKTPKRSQTTVNIRKTKLPFSLNTKEFEKETKRLEKLMNQKKKNICKIDIHQRNLNKDEKKLRLLVKMGDFVGY